MAQRTRRGPFNIANAIKVTDILASSWLRISWNDSGKEASVHFKADLGSTLCLNKSIKSEDGFYRPLQRSTMRPICTFQHKGEECWAGNQASVNTANHVVCCCSRATDCRGNVIPTFTKAQWILNFWKTHFSTSDAVCNQRWRGVTWITTVYPRQHESTLPCGNLWPAQSTGASLICLVSIFRQCAFVYLSLQLKQGSWPKTYRYQWKVKGNSDVFLAQMGVATLRRNDWWISHTHSWMGGRSHLSI